MISFLHIQTALHEGKTILKKGYQTTPFKVANITEDRSRKALELMLMTSSPGVLDGDELNMTVEVSAGCSLHLHTQSYQRLFTMKSGAFQHMEVHVAEGASFCYLPYPVVPHRGANFVARNKIFLSQGSSLIWGEVLTCGRKLSGEAFEFAKYHNLTEVYLKKKLVIKENLLVQPAQAAVASIGHWEGYTHQASLLFVNENILVPQVVAALQTLLSSEDVCFGVSALPVNGVVVRMLGHKGEQLHNLQKRLATLATLACTLADKTVA